MSEFVCGESGSKRVSSVLKGIWKGEPNFAAERALLGNAALSFALLLVLDLAAYFVFFKSVPHFDAFAPIILLIAVGAVANVSALFHFKSFKSGFSCMSGMMIGMTLGMISGFMFGALAGAMNGMFIGSLAGMLGGMAAGAYSGSCCGVMGTMEGLMAGIMSGTMGAMLSVMLLADHLIAFLFVLFAALCVVLAGLSYMMVKESGPSQKTNSFATFFCICFVITMFLNWLVIYGPKSGAFWSG